MPVPPWFLHEPDVDLSILDKIRNKDAGNLVASTSKHLNENWAGYMQIYTDGSKHQNRGRAAIGVSIPHLQIQLGKRVSTWAAVFATELVAILWALGGWRRLVQSM